LANFNQALSEWSPFKIVPVSTVLYPRWPPLLKIENFSNGVWFKLDQWFQRRRFLKKFTDGRQVMAIAHTGELTKAK
jgi:hypothetical protein